MGADEGVTVIKGVKADKSKNKCKGRANEFCECVGGCGEGI